jgi:hypothetical protein
MNRNLIHDRLEHDNLDQIILVVALFAVIVTTFATVAGWLLGCA